MVQLREMNSSGKLVVLLAVSACLLPSAAATYRNLAELHDVAHQAIETDDEFDLTGTVILPSSPQDKTFELSDGTNALTFVDGVLWPRQLLSAGGIVRVRGACDLERNLKCRRIEILGEAPPANAPRVRVKDVLKGLYPERIVRLGGTVRKIVQDDIDQRWVFITIIDDGDMIQIRFMPSEAEFRQLQRLRDAEVLVTGYTGPRLTSRQSFRRFQPTVLSVRFLSDFQIVRAAPADPFSAPPLDTGRFDPSSAADSKRTAVGRVLAAYNGTTIILGAFSNTVINVELAGHSLPPIGSVVRVSGYPATDLFRVNLTDALWREEPEVAQGFEDSAPKDMREQILKTNQGHPIFNADCHGRTLRVRGHVRALPKPGQPTSRLLIEEEDLDIPINIEQCPQVIDGLRPDTLIEATGTCVMPTENWSPDRPRPQIQDTFLALRTADDLVVLRRPSRWTAIHFLSLIGFLLAGLAAVLAWNRFLRRKVELRSRELLEEQIAHVTSDLKTMERTRLAIELHDSLAQNLTGVALELQTARETVLDDARRSLFHLDTANRSLMSCREELRNCLRDLRSDALETTDINEAIRLTLDPHLGSAQAQIRFNVPRERFSDNTLHAVLCIVRELVINAVRHGDASKVRIAGAIEGRELLFSVEDDGCGFDVANRPGMREGHFGLQGIQERINGYKGQMKISSVRGKGTKVTLSMKLPQGEDK